MNFGYSLEEPKKMNIEDSLEPMNFEDSLAEVEYKMGLPANFVWKQQQLECLRAVFQGKDIMAVLPTGFGKSIIFQSTPFLLSARDGWCVEKTEYITLIITPLNAIMMDQCRELTKKGIQACYMDYNCQKNITFGHRDDDDESYEEVPAQEDGNLQLAVPREDIEEGKYNLVYCHPETLLCSNGRKLYEPFGRRWLLWQLMRPTLS